MARPLGYKHSEESKLKMSKPRRPFSEETKRRMSEAHKGQSRRGIKGHKAWNAGVQSPFSPDTLKRMSDAQKGVKKPPRSEEYRRHISESKMSEKHPNWKGGVCSEYNRVRNTREYRRLRLDALNRDVQTCQECGGIEERMEVDHIKSFAHHPELRFELSNLRTLCKPCHIKTANYGGRNVIRR